MPVLSGCKATVKVWSMYREGPKTRNDNTSNNAIYIAYLESHINCFVPL